MSVATVNVAAPLGGTPVRGGKSRKTNHPDRNDYVDRTDQAFEIFWNNAKCTLSNGKLCEEFDQCKRSNFSKRCESDMRVLKMLNRSLYNPFNSLDEIKGLIITLHYLLENLTPYLRKLPNLNKLEIRGDVFDNTSHASFPAEVGDLSNLETLVISGNKWITSLPAELGKLSKLKTLIIDNNFKIRSLPVELGNLKNLETLKIYSNYSLESLPDQLGNLSNLKTLKIHSNDSLTSLPAALGKLSNLETLVIIENETLELLPDQLGNLSNLKTLKILRNYSLASIPDGLDNLPNLKTKRISLEE